MKTQNAIIIGCAVAVAAVALAVSAVFFPLRLNDLTDNTLQLAIDASQQRISGYRVQDYRFNNNSRSYIYQLKQKDGENRYCAVSYYKHPLFARYRLADFADYSHISFKGILLAQGLPYEVAYDISGYTLEFKNAALNQHLIIGIGILIMFVLGMAAIRSRRFFAANKIKTKRRSTGAPKANAIAESEGLK